MKINPNDPAMPRVGFDKDGILTTIEPEFSGMTIRTQLAAMAMQGLTMRVSGWENVTDVASKAVQIADALIAELNEK